jgi:hypothetical protein
MTMLLLPVVRLGLPTTNTNVAVARSVIERTVAVAVLLLPSG